MNIATAADAADVVARGQERVDLGGEHLGPRAAAGQQVDLVERVEGEDEAQDGDQRDHPGQLRQQDVAEDLRRRRAVDARRLLESPGTACSRARMNRNANGNDFQDSKKITISSAVGTPTLKPNSVIVAVLLAQERDRRVPAEHVGPERVHEARAAARASPAR